MIISAVKFPGRQLLMHPDPAVLHVGDKVAWQVLADSKILATKGRLRWTIYFKPDQHPFASPSSQWDREVRPGESGTIEAGTAKKPGDFKYGIRIVDSETGEQVSDDDPILI